jgi:hypothetical protein
MEFNEAETRAKLVEMFVPPHLHDGIILYLFSGIEMGSCLTAVFENNLMEAFGRADIETALSMKGICGFIYNYTPNACHGSRDKVKAWLKAHADKRAAAPSQG